MIVVINFPEPVEYTYNTLYYPSIWMRVRIRDRGEGLPSPLHAFDPSLNIAYISRQVSFIFCLSCKLLLHFMFQKNIFTDFAVYLQLKL